MTPEEGLPENLAECNVMGRTWVKVMTSNPPNPQIHAVYEGVRDSIRDALVLGQINFNAGFRMLMTWFSIGILLGVMLDVLARWVLH